MVLSVAKFVPAGLHVYQTLDGKINVKTLRLVSYICISWAHPCSSALGQSFPLPTTCLPRLSSHGQSSNNLFDFYNV